MRQAVGRDRFLDLAGWRWNIDAPQHHEGDGEKRHDGGNDDEDDLHRIPGQLPIADGFVINSPVSLSQTIQPRPESVPAEHLNLDRPVILVGLMGAGKTRVGRRLAERLGLPFLDIDIEIETETGKTITELFSQIGEPAFREGERRMIARLMHNGISVIATGGGAFMDPQTRANIRDHALSVWLRADLDTLVARTARSQRRPLLQGLDRAAKLSELMTLRYPIYAEAHLTVDSFPGPVEQTVDAVLAALRLHCGIKE
ncbi:MAG: aroK [Rhodospirillales bacterium]|nr:aroK [Rhodospirillales bacterium]